MRSAVCRAAVVDFLEVTRDRQKRMAKQAALLLEHPHHAGSKRKKVASVHTLRPEEPLGPQHRHGSRRSSVAELAGAGSVVGLLDVTTIEEGEEGEEEEEEEEDEKGHHHHHHRKQHERQSTALVVHRADARQRNVTSGRGLGDVAGLLSYEALKKRAVDSGAGFGDEGAGGAALFDEYGVPIGSAEQVAAYHAAVAANAEHARHMDQADLHAAAGMHALGFCMQAGGGGGQPRRHESKVERAARLAAEELARLQVLTY